MSDLVQRPDEDDPVRLWAEIHRLRAALQGPTGYSSWQDAATDERMRRVKAEAEIERLRKTVESQEAELMRTWFVLKDFGAHPGRTDDRLSDCVRAEIERLRKDAERYRYLRDRVPAEVLGQVKSAAGCWIDSEDDEGTLMLLTGDDADAAIDAAKEKT